MLVSMGLGYRLLRRLIWRVHISVHVSVEVHVNTHTSLHYLYCRDAYVHKCDAQTIRVYIVYIGIDKIYIYIHIYIYV